MQQSERTETESYLPFQMFLVLVTCGLQIQLLWWWDIKKWQQILSPSASWTVASVPTADLIFSCWWSLLLSPQVLSGCAIIVRGQPRGGPPPERQINLSNIRAGAMARRAAQAQPDTKDTPDEVSSFIPLCLFLFVWKRLDKILLSVPSAHAGIFPIRVGS